MTNTITLPMNRVAGLVAETGDVLPERAVSKLLSVLYSRRMWAHFDAKKSTDKVAVFVCGDNVPTLTKRSARNGKAVA